MTSPVAAEAVMQDREGRTALRFERSLSHPPEKVWEALTDPGEMAAWHPSPPATFPLEVGATIDFEDTLIEAEGVVTELDPPRVLAYTWGGDELRWELEPRDGGCTLILTHTFDDHYKAARDAAGWHLCLDALTASLDAGPGTGREDAMKEAGDWRELNSVYEERFGISPEEATPPPSRD
jgi:uncharacterized protein YndB with AHSA1/START domain